MEASDIMNNLQEGATKAVRLPDGRFVTDALAKKSWTDDMVLDMALASYREKLQKLPPPPPGYYYAMKITSIRYEGGRVFCEGCIYVEPIIEEDEK